MSRGFAGYGRKRTTRSPLASLGPSALGKVIKARRERKGWSQAEFARQCRLDQAEICRLESGQRRSILMATALRMSDALGCGLNQLWHMPVEGEVHAGSKPAGQ